MTTSIITPQIASFAAAVRDALHDLPAEERDDLTDGLEADLAEAYAEDLARELPDPVEYATELRNAAGLPKVESASAGMFTSMAASMRRMRADLEATFGANPTLAAVAAFFVAVRPLWWMVRAWVAAWLVAAFFGTNAGYAPRTGLMWLVFGVFLVISVQWGRDRWSAAKIAPLIVLGNILAAVLVVPVAAAASHWTTEVNYSYVDGGPGDLTGVYLDGEQVTNVFPYTADGKPLTDVQLFTQDGQPLRATVDGSDGCLDPACNQNGIWVPRALAGGQEARNVYPMAMAPGVFSDESGLYEADPNDSVAPRPLPFAQAPALLAPEKAAPAEKVAPSNE